MTLDPDVAEHIRREMKQRGIGLKAIVNEALRRGLRISEPTEFEPFRVEAHDLGVLPGIDLDRMNQLIDELESESYSGESRP